MNIVLWRHADAELSTPDMTRELTPKGRRQAKSVARWLEAQLPKDTRVLVSPAARALQTAEALEREIEIVPGLAPDESVNSYVRVIANNLEALAKKRSTIILVGHQPLIGRTIGRLLSGVPKTMQEPEYESDVSVRKGQVWWLTARPDSKDLLMLIAKVRLVLGPELLDD
jgi:phosphohistidine phosphatase